jgi:hypothetical protein
MITPPLMLGRNEPTPCKGCPYFTSVGCVCDNEGHLWPQRPDYEGAVLAFLGFPALAALLTDDDHRRQLLDIRDLIDDDDLARAWLIGMNPALYDRSPLGAIADGHGEAALIAARDFA